MEKENFNVKVSNKIVEILDRDMEIFNQKNRNSMINKIILTYLKIKNEDDVQEKIFNDIKKIDINISEEKEKKIKEIIRKNLYGTLKIKKGNSKLINFHLNKKTFQECKSLGENLNYFDTEFFRVIFEWYSLKAKYEREQILFYEEMAIIKEAIDKKYELEFKVKDNNAKLLKITNSYPFEIFESKDENYNYFVTATDVITQDGYVVNKVGTCNTAIVASYYSIPYYAIGFPNQKHKTIKDVKIEMREGNEVLEFAFIRVAENGVKGLYPAFDITPPELIQGIATDKGIYKAKDIGAYL